MDKQKITNLDNLIPIFCERLESGQSVKFSPQGTSMLPFIREGKDSVVISPVTAKPEKYDVVLYRRKSGQYVLHRIVWEGDTYTMMGDNQFSEETGICHDQLIAVMTSFERGKKEHSVDEKGYKIYCRLWYHSRHIRRFVKRCKRWVVRHLGGKK